VLRGYLPVTAIDNLALNILQPFFAGIFIVLAGISSRFSHSRKNIKRGLLLAGCALLVSVAGLVAGMPIWFGILHLLAACILLYTLLEKLRITVPTVAASAFFLTWFGLTKWPVVPSADYFPIVPWGFLFFFGVWLGGPIRDGLLPGWFYSVKIPILPVIGRKTLFIYLLHQPVMYGILWIAESVYM
jgi:uncharacterized membrane protein